VTIITSEIIEQFQEKKRALIERGSDPFNRIDASEQVMFEIRDGKRDVWVIVHRSGETIYEQLHTLEAIRNLTNRFNLFELVAVPAGMHAQEAEQRSAEIEEMRLDEEFPCFWIGDADKYGAECGLLLEVLLPRREDALPTYTQMKLELLSKGIGDASDILYTTEEALDRIISRRSKDSDPLE
jgi:hypothetical protein